ncbi:MAG: tail fiber protein [Deltaproteobacteria bacterium]|nr:MAG: tail fiber protein [Deltaproteobacteria bacterium]
MNHPTQDTCSFQAQLDRVEQKLTLLEQAESKRQRKTQRTITKIFGLLTCLVVLVSVWLAHAQQHSLVYSGYLEEAGQPLNETRQVSLSLWDQGEAGKGTPKCKEQLSDVVFVKGRFKITLSQECNEVTRKTSPLWVEIKIYDANKQNPKTLARTKLGAVPHTENRLPAGTVISYAAPISLDANKKPIPPHGWLYCDGSWYKTADHPELFKALKGHYGLKGTGTSQEFRVPDYRGYFLRGVAGGGVGEATRVPDLSNRYEPGTNQAIKPKGPYSTNPVGTTEVYQTALPSGGPILQTEQKTHSHKGFYSEFSGYCFAPGNGVPAVSCFPNPPAKYKNTGLVGAKNVSVQNETLQYKIIGGGNETRPSNVFVHYLIKY